MVWKEGKREKEGGEREKQRQRGEGLKWEKEKDKVITGRKR